MRRAAGAVSLLLARANGITVDGSHKHSSDDIDEDDFKWEKLPGRCCFLIHEECPYEKAPRELCTKTSATTCDECNVWSEPDNFCHTSPEACDTCSMELYCPAPPPLVAGNKVCTGASRVGQGCFDELMTGVCASHTMADCQDACRKNNNCEGDIACMRADAIECDLKESERSASKSIQTFPKCLRDCSPVAAALSPPRYREILRHSSSF